MINRLDLVDCIEDVKSLKANYTLDKELQRKAQAVIESATKLIKYYDERGWPSETEE